VNVLQIHEDFVRKMLNLVVADMQRLQILQVPKHIFGQILDLVDVQIQNLKFFKMLEVCTFDEFDLLMHHKKNLQVLESLTDSSEDVVERLKIYVQYRHIPIFLDVLL
jgi:hypothetical protein